MRSVDEANTTYTQKSPGWVREERFEHVHSNRAVGDGGRGERDVASKSRRRVRDVRGRHREVFDETSSFCDDDEEKEEEQEK